jgi:mono/diheme cytochrome c family protein
MIVAFARLSVLTLMMAILVLLPAHASAQASLKNTKPDVTVSAADQTAFGKDLFRQHCASCHFSETTAQKIGPGLKGLYTRLTFANGRKVTDGSLAKWIENGGKNMPGFKETIKPEQVRALISYIRTL